MNVEKIERIAVERILSVAPGIASAEVILTLPLNLPPQVKGDGYTGLAVIGAGRAVPNASVQAHDFPSLKGTLHERNMAISYFALVMDEQVHIYLENQSILDFLRR